MIESNDAVEQDPFCAKLINLESEVELKRYANPNLWVWIEDFGKMHVPREILEAITTWLKEELA